MSQWYVEDNGNPTGPFSVAEMKKKAQAGEVMADTLVRKGRSGEWVKANRVKGLLAPATTLAKRQIPALKQSPAEPNPTHSKSAEFEEGSPAIGRTTSFHDDDKGTCWYYQIMGDVIGPLSADELRAHAQDGNIAADTFVRRGEEGEWVSAESVSGLLSHHRSGPPDIQRPTPSAATETQTHTIGTEKNSIPSWVWGVIAVGAVVPLAVICIIVFNQTSEKTDDPPAVVKRDKDTSATDTPSVPALAPIQTDEKSAKASEQTITIADMRKTLIGTWELNEQGDTVSFTEDGKSIATTDDYPLMLLTGNWSLYPEGDGIILRVINASRSESSTRVRLEGEDRLITDIHYPPSYLTLERADTTPSLVMNPPSRTPTPKQPRPTQQYDPAIVDPAPPKKSAEDLFREAKATITKGGESWVGGPHKPGDKFLIWPEADRTYSIKRPNKELQVRINWVANPSHADRTVRIGFAYSHGNQRSQGSVGPYNLEGSSGTFTYRRSFEDVEGSGLIAIFFTEHPGFEPITNTFIIKAQTD